MIYSGPNSWLERICARSDDSDDFVAAAFRGTLKGPGVQVTEKPRDPGNTFAPNNSFQRTRVRGGRGPGPVNSNR